MVYKLFISHAWKYDELYNTLEKKLNQYEHDSNYEFIWTNYSVPRAKPLLDPNSSHNDKELTAALDEQIRQSSCVLIIAGMYVPYKKWIKKEIELAKKYNKKIIGIEPWGSERIPLDVQLAADVMVGWNTPTIVKAIENLVGK